MNMLEKRILLALGGLFHDVGKLAQRAGESVNIKEDLGYAHAKFSYEFIEDVFGAKIPKEEDYWVVLAGAYHHKPEAINRKFFQIAKLFRQADIISSKERSEKEDKNADIEYKRLKSVFLGIRLENFPEQSDKNYYIDLAPLELREDVLFPKEGKPEEGKDKYKMLYKSFKEDIQSVDLSDSRKAFLKIYHIFYRYCWCVPASIYDTERHLKHYPDISLFDHSRMVSAIACALYTEYNKKHPGEEKFLLVDGDISGIQDFMFSLANEKGVAKRLRGRSFFLSILPHLVGRALLWEFEYPLCNLIFAGGGKFLALLGYEEGIEDRLKSFAYRVERSLIKAFGGKLGFVMSYVDVDRQSLTEDFRNTMKKLHDKISRQKKRKFSLTMKEFEKLVKDRDGSVICPYCRWEVLKEGQEVCNWCDTFYRLGDAILKAKYVAFDRNEPANKNITCFYLEDIGSVYLLEEENSDFYEVYLINDTNFLKKKENSNSNSENEKKGEPDGFIFLARYAPKTQEGSTIDFDTLAKKAKGDKKIAFVKGDVDLMGLILQSIEEYSLSRLATLSRSLDLFFSGYLNIFLQGSDVYTLYAGGEDFFLIGPWDLMVEKVLELKRAFDRYTAYNPSINLSIGVHINKPKAPIKYIGELAIAEEKKVKEKKIKLLINESKDKKDGLPHFSILGEFLTEEELENALKNSELLIRLIEKNMVGRATLYRIYMLMRSYKEYQKKHNSTWWKFYPLFYYQVHRNVKPDSQEDFIEAFISKKENYTLREEALFATKYVIMKTRNVLETEGKEG